MKAFLIFSGQILKKIIRDRSRTQLPCSARGPAGSLHSEWRRGTARGRDSCTWAAGRHRAVGRHRAGAAGRFASGGWHRGSRRGTARGLTASLGQQACWEPAPRGARGGGGGGVAGGRRTAFPQGISSWKGARTLAGTRQALSLAAGRNSAAAARHWRAGRPGRRRADGLAG